MADLDIQSMRKILGYDSTRQYFGEMTFSGLRIARCKVVGAQTEPKAYNSVSVKVGNIDGGVICRALWNEMSYNPERFGTESPFIKNGVEDIYRFCNELVAHDTPGYKIVYKLNRLLVDFLRLNGATQNEMQADKVKTDGGTVKLAMHDIDKDNNYMMLIKLRDAIRCVIDQNIADLDIASYREKMAKVIAERHPDGRRHYNENTNPQPTKKQKFSKAAEYVIDAEDTEERLDRAEENAKITLDNSRYYSAEQAEQAQNDLERIKALYDNEHDSK